MSFEKLSASPEKKAQRTWTEALRKEIRCTAAAIGLTLSPMFLLYYDLYGPKKDLHIIAKQNAEQTLDLEEVQEKISIFRKKILVALNAGTEVEGMIEMDKDGTIVFHVDNKLFVNRNDISLLHVRIEPKGMVQDVHYNPHAVLDKEHPEGEQAIEWTLKGIGTTPMTFGGFKRIIGELHRSEEQFVSVPMESDPPSLLSVTAKDTPPKHFLFERIREERSLAAVDALSSQ